LTNRSRQKHDLKGFYQGPKRLTMVIMTEKEGIAGTVRKLVEIGLQSVDRELMTGGMNSEVFII
jgi:hypothetical protein